MATANGQKTAITADQRKQIIEGLGMLAASLHRSARGAKTDSIREAYAKEAAQVDNTVNKLASGELDL